MAFKKIVETGYGINLEYWKINKLFINYHEGIVTIWLHGWINKQIRDENKGHLAEEVYTWLGEQVPFDWKNPGDILKACYDKLKLEDKWKDVEDI